MDEIVSRVVAAIPGSFVVDQHLNLTGVRGLLDCESIVETDGERLFHHDVDAVTGADFDYAAMIVSVGVDQNGLGAGFLQHFFHIGEQ